MIVAYDLRYASDHFAGIGKHAYALLESLLELPGEERYAVLWDPRERTTRYDLGALRANPRVEWHEHPYHFIHPWGAWQVGRWLRRVKPDVYLSPFSLRPFFSGVPEVLTVHDVAALRVAHAASPHLNHLLYLSLLYAARASALITDSEFSRGEIVATLPVPPRRVHAILLGVPASPASPVVPRRPAGWSAERFAIVVGDNRPRKNLAMLARAWSELGPSDGLVLAGIGPVDPRFPSLEQEAQRAGALQVTQLGWVPPEEWAWLYENAELLVLPSYYEGFGFPVLEAFVAGLPAVVSDIPVFREVGVAAAAYVDPHDPAAWVREVRRVASDAEARERMRAAGRARAGELTYQATATATLALLREMPRASR